MSEEKDIITLEFDDGTELEAEILGIFDVEEKEYIALVPADSDEEVLLYGYKELDNDEFELIDIKDDAEFDKVANAFDDLMAAEEE